MQSSVGDRILKFVPVPLRFETSVKADAFALKNNKTVGETLSHPKYRALERMLFASYSTCSERKLGESLFRVKCSWRFVSTNSFSTHMAAFLISVFLLPIPPSQPHWSFPLFR